VGGNGMGKTTFVNIIKYAIIGHYKEGYDLTRTYQGKRIEKRTTYALNYFSKRTDDSLSLDEPSFVEIIFKINGAKFKIKRGLSSIELLELQVNSDSVVGEVISQENYDQLFYNYSREVNPIKEKELFNKLKKTLPHKYEKEVEKYTNIEFDDLIFFVNKILFFGEDHKTILWENDPFNDVQTELFNKYFNDRLLNNERQEAIRQAKYYDTQARHKSEDIRVIKKVLDKVEPERKNSNPVETKISDLREKKAQLSNSIESLQEERKLLDKELSINSNHLNSLSLKVSEYEREAKEKENEFLKNKWVTLHKNYDSFVQSLSTNEICPLCSQDIEEEFVSRKMQQSDCCLLCEQTITIYSEKNNLSNDANEAVKKIHNAIRNYHRTVNETEEKLKILDSKFRKSSQKMRSLNHEIRLLEYKQVNEETTGEKPDNLQTIYNEIGNLEILKEEFQEKSRMYKARAQEISHKIEKEITKNVKTFSGIFSSFAENFLGMKASLTYEEFNNQKRFLPVIDGKIRETEEELSESQRFFVDHSFRMSILTFFYNSPSFYIVETPDSSLDITYEKNAANVFLQFLEKPYAVILTTNLNNSEFLNYLAQSKIKKGIINLLKIGKQSPIQEQNDLLENILEKVQFNLNEN